MIRGMASIGGVAASGPDQQPQVVGDDVPAATRQDPATEGPGGQAARPAAGQALFSLDAAGCIATWNEEAQALAGYLVDEAIGMPLAALLPAADDADGLVAADLATAAATGRARREVTLLGRDASAVRAELSLSALRGAGGALQGFVAALRPVPGGDVAVAAAIDHSAETLRLMVGSVVDYAIFALDPEGRVATWNEGARCLKQYEAEEIAGRHFSVFYPLADREAGKPQRLLDEAARNGRVEDEGWRVRKDGSRFWANVVITALRGADGELRGFAKVTRDLTERKLADEALRQSEERFRLMVEGVSDYAIFMLDPEGTVTTWNEGARRLKQYEAEEIIGLHFSMFYPAEDRAAGKPERLLEQARNNGSVADTGWRVRKDGSRFWADVVITALHDSGGKLRGFAKVTRDLTERRRAEEQLREVAEREHAAAVQLREANRRRRNLVAIVAHDLRAPIGVLHGTADTLVGNWDRLDDERRLRSLQLMLSSSARLRALVDDVLDMSSIEAGTLHYDIGTIDLGTVIRRAAADVDRDAQRIRLSLPAVAVLVRADERRTWQVATNLMSNALKFSALDQVVEVSVESDGEMATVSVSDHGIGLTEEQARDVFKPFSRVGEQGGSPSPEGTGLGLYIARSLVTDQGGHVGVRSQPGAGSTFWFSLPLAEPK